MIYCDHDITTVDISENEKSYSVTKEEIKMTANNSTSIKTLGSIRLASLVVLAAAYILLLFGHTGLIELTDTVMRLAGVMNLVAIPVMIFASVRIKVLKERNN